MRRRSRTTIVGALGALIIAAGLGGFALMPVGTSASGPEISPAITPAITPASVVVSNDLGYDISYPQCPTNITLPATHVFAVIGVNGGKATTSNGCFQRQLAWALTSAGGANEPAAALYVNTGNPGLAATWWPQSNTTHVPFQTPISNPKGTCNHKAGAACAYVYGYSAAEADWNAANTANPSATFKWWLDVETSNSWSSTDTSANAASLAGMVAYFKTKGVTVGIYSTGYQWGRIAGKTPSTSALAKLPSWLAGYSSSTAAAACASSPLTPGGRVALIQYGSGGFDRDLSCDQFTTAAAAITGTPTANKRLTAVVTTSAPGSIATTYQWKTNGKSIPHATKSYHTVTTAERGKKLTVTVVIKKTGYNTRTVASASVTISKPR
jgi:hypothetical protein